MFRFVLLTAVTLHAFVANGQTPRKRTPTKQAGPKTKLDNASQWKYESLLLKDGTEFRGLILSQRNREIEFAEIIRKPGTPMHAVIRPVSLDAVDKVSRLPERQRKVLVDNFWRFRNRSTIELGRMKNVSLKQANINGEKRWTYAGDWFHLQSTADQEMTRRCIVRIEQIFRAYRQLLPPRHVRPVDEDGPSEKLQIVLFGTNRLYRRYLKNHNLEIENKAFYSTRLNTIVAASDLDHFAQELRRTRDADRKQLVEVRSKFRKLLSATEDELKQLKYSPEEIVEELNQIRGAWKRQHSLLLNRVEKLQQSNNAEFDQRTGQMFRRLYHEAFHAYLENYAYPGSQTPRWLNEGLAQIFESGQLDAGLLRIDAPDREMLGQLKKELMSRAMPLAEVLNAKEQAFLLTHAKDGSKRHYLYSWGLTYYLIFQRGLFSDGRLERYVFNAQQLDAIPRFRELTGQPLNQFESAWRKSMLELKSIR